MSPLLVLQARAEARALLFAACEYADLDEALRPLFDFALDSGIADEIGADAMFTIVRKAFEGIAEVKDDAPLFAEVGDYNATDDFARSIDEAYRVIRERMANGGPGWTPP